MTHTLQYWLDKAATASPEGRAFYAGALNRLNAEYPPTEEG